MNAVGPQPPVVGDRGLNLSRLLDRSLLPRVEKPSRYLGTETNAVTASDKDLEQVEVRIALTFPDLYDIGLGNLGLHILYAILNKLPWCWAERAYALVSTWKRFSGSRVSPSSHSRAKTASTRWTALASRSRAS